LTAGAAITVDKTATSRGTALTMMVAAAAVAARDQESASTVEAMTTGPETAPRGTGVEADNEAEAETRSATAAMKLATFRGTAPREAKKCTPLGVWRQKDLDP